MTSTQSVPSVAPPLLLWLLIQIASLTSSAARIPLSAHWVQPGESMALAQLALVQMVTLSLFAPLLLRTRARHFTMILSAAPMLQLAAMLSAAPPSSAALVFAATTCSATILAAALALFPEAHHLFLVALANLLTLGGLALHYFTHEFAGSGALPDAALGPAVAALRLAGDNPVLLPAVAWLLVPALVSLLALVVRRAMQKPLKLSAPT